MMIRISILTKGFVTKGIGLIIYPREGVDVGCFVSSGETTLVAFSICSNVFFVSVFQLLYCFLDHLVTPFVPHRLRTEKLLANMLV